MRSFEHRVCMGELFQAGTASGLSCLIGKDMVRGLISKLELSELIDLVNSVIIFKSQMTLLRWSTFLLRSLTVTLTVLLYWISFL